MAFPGENFVLRLLEPDQPQLHSMKVLDVAVAGTADTIALVGWAFGGVSTITQAGFSVLRFDINGNLMWQVSRQLCSLPNVECGQFEIEAHLTPARNGVIVGGSGIKLFDTTRRPISFAVRIDDLGNVLWARSYVATSAIPDPGRVTAIGPLQTPDRFVLAAYSYPHDHTWLFEIDGNGRVVTAFTRPHYYVRRLRLTSQGLFAVGDFTYDRAAIHSGILCLDPKALGGVWISNYFYGVEAPEHGVRWFDIAEGTDSLLVVGNMVVVAREDWPMMMFVRPTSAGPKAGDVIRAFRPKLGDHPVRMRNVASFIEDVVPVLPAERVARFCVTGEAQGRPLQFIMREDGTIEWQKAYRTAAGETATLGPVRWPAFQHILAGGTIRSGSRSRAFLTSSLVSSALPAKANCGTEVGVTLPDNVMYRFHPTPSLEPLSLETRECYLDEGPMLRVKRTCLDGQ